MKKFGTPIGARPGREKENVGFAGVGTPPWPVRLGDFAGLASFLVLAFVFFLLLFPCGFEALCCRDVVRGVWPGCLDGVWLVPGPLGCGGFGFGAVVVAEVEVEVDGVVVDGAVVDEEDDVDVVVEVDVDVGLDVVEVDVEVDVDGAVEVVVDDVVVDDVVVDGVVDVVVLVVVLVVLVVVLEQDSVSLTTTPVTGIGSLIEESGVPGATSTLKVTFDPP